MDRLFPRSRGSYQEVQSIVADDAQGTINSILPGVRAVTVTAVTNNADDFIVLPAIASVPIGHTIVVNANAASNFEVRTPASSGTTINNVDSDGTAEYLATNLDSVMFTKTSATRWIGVSYTSLGAVRTAVIPDA